MMVLGEEEGLECEIHVEGVQFECVYMNQVQVLPSFVGRGEWEESCKYHQVPG